MKTLGTSRRKQLGIGLVEMSIAAVVIAVFLVGILVALPKLQLDQRLNKARQEIPLTLNAMTAAYATQASTEGASTRILSAANIWPKDRVIDPGKASVRVNGVFPGSREYVFPNTEEVPPRMASAQEGFAYWIQNIPSEACLPLVQLLVSQRSVTDVTVSPSTTPPSGARGASRVTVWAHSNIQVHMKRATDACSTPGNKSITAYVSRL